MQFVLWIEYEDERTHHIELQRIEVETPREASKILREWIFNRGDFENAWLLLVDGNGKTRYADFDVAKRILQEKEIRAARSTGECL